MTSPEPDPSSPSRKSLVGIVGPCTAGKSTLIRRLAPRGINTRHIAQEHSYVPYMWQRLAHPDVLIYLDVSFPVSLQRRPGFWDEMEYQEQLRRLEHARAHADYYLLTDTYTEEEVAQQVLDFLNSFDPQGVV